MPAVDQPQLHRLVGTRVGHEQRARGLPRRPAPAEGVLEHPLAERLAHDGRLVARADQPARRRRGRRPWRPARCGRPSCRGSRRGRRSSPPARPARRARRSPRRGRAAARRCGGGCRRRRSPAARRRRRRAAPPGRARAGPPACAAPAARQVRRDVGVARVEAPAPRIVVVAGLGDRERDDVGALGREAVAQRVGLLGGHERLAHDAHHARAILLRPALEQREEPVLLGQRVDHRTAAPARPADAPRAGLGRDGVLGVDGLVRAVEGAEAEVHDADLQLARVHGRARDLVQGAEAEPHAAALRRARRARSRPRRARPRAPARPRRGRARPRCPRPPTPRAGRRC